MKPVHPGRILKRELVARELSANKLALALRVPSGRITSILNGKRAITPETALILKLYMLPNWRPPWRSMLVQLRHFSGLSPCLPIDHPVTM